MSDASDMNGLWSGTYLYNDGDGVMFSAWIDDAGGVLSGTTLEPNTFGPTAAAELEAHISGTRNGRSVQFSKIYAPSTGIVQAALNYEGTANDAFTEVLGQWSASDFPSFNGRFRLSRLKAARAKAEENSILLPIGS